MVAVSGQQMVPEKIKLRYCEKATKFDKILILHVIVAYSVASKQVGDIFKKNWPFQKAWSIFKNYYRDSFIR